MIYFTSDQHFYHERIIEMKNRPFKNVEEMNAMIIKNWNDRIMAKDEVYILGDVTMKGEEFALEVLSQLKGRKYLILGNHDKFALKKTFPDWVFEWIKDYYELKYNNDVFTLFHYPILEWNGYHKGYYQLHGHQHNGPEYNLNNIRNGIRRYDVGVDANGFKPVSLEEIVEKFRV
jgi:calcineurin-like phosphoesterase family protein